MDRGFFLVQVMRKHPALSLENTRLLVPGPTQ
jgi:hypothetical protein